MTVTITYATDNNELKSIVLNEITTITCHGDDITFIDMFGKTHTYYYCDITFSVFQEVNMLHTVYICNKDKRLVKQGQIYCDDYCLFVYGNEMLLSMLSDNIIYSIRGSYIIVI